MNSTIIGKVLDNYRILQNIGRGGMGFVFKALNIKLNKLVAIKMIAPALAMNDSFMSRFEAEAKTLAKLENPNIVGIHDLRVDSDYAYIVMEYVEGVTLGRLIKEKGPIPWRQALKLFNQMLNAINHAHKEGIIHRDIKPNNILINRQGVVKVTDFGLAKNQAEFGLTQSVTTGGTLFYMSPEQVKGLVYTDERSDIYALGFTLYEMLTGSTPFSTDHTDFDIREAIIRTKFPPPHQTNKKIPAKLGRIVEKAISKKPEERYQNITEFKAAIDEFKEYEENRRIRSEEAATLMNGQEQPKNNGVITSHLFQNTSTDVKKDETSKIETGKLTRKIIYYSVAASVLLLTILKLTGLLDYPAGIQNHDGLISVTSIPNHAIVFINGDSIGQTPIDKYQLKAASVNLLIMKDDYFSVDTTVQIKSDEPVKLDTQLQPAAHLVFEVEPADANLSVNDHDIPGGNKRSVLLAVGRHHLKLQHEDYQSYNLTFNAEQGLNPVIRLNLLKNGGTKTEEQSLFKINSNPSGASVYLDNKYVGKTPFQTDNLDEKNYALRLSKPGYQDYSDHFNVLKGESRQINERLILLTGSVDVISDPPGARIYLGDKLLKNITPFNIKNVPAGNNTITVKKDGYTDYSTTIYVRSGNTETINASLEQMLGSLSILAIPWGNIFIDDKLVLKEAQLKKTFELSAGNHQLRVEHPTLGIYDKTIRVEDKKITEVIVNFNKTHSVHIEAKDLQGSDINAEILVDGKKTGETTPISLNLATGTYTISVIRNGYILADGPKKITIDETVRTPLSFVMKKSNQ